MKFMRFVVASVLLCGTALAGQPPFVVPPFGVGPLTAMPAYTDGPLTLSSAIFDASTPKFGAGALSGGAATMTSLAGAANVVPAPPYTVEGWLKITSAPGIEVAIGQAGAFYIGINGSGQAVGASYTGAANSTGVTAGTISGGAWHHVELDVGATSTILFVDGVPGTPVAVAAGVYSPTPLTLLNLAGGFLFTGEVDEVAVWSGLRHTATFTPPSTAYLGTETNLQALWHLDGNGNNGVPPHLLPFVAGSTGIKFFLPNSNSAVTYSVAPNSPAQPAIGIPLSNSTSGQTFSDYVAASQNVYIEGVGGSVFYRWY